MNISFLQSPVIIFQPHILHILLLLSSDLWPGIFLFFCFSPIFDWEFSLFFFFSSNLWLGIFSFSFAFLRSLIGDFLFFFCFLKHIHNLTVNETSFLGAPPVLSSEGKGKKSYPGSRFMAKGLGFWLKRLAEGKTWRMSGYLLGKKFRDKGMPHVISMTCI